MSDDLQPDPDVERVLRLREQLPGEPCHAMAVIERLVDILTSEVHAPADPEPQLPDNVVPFPIRCPYGMRP